MEDMISKIKRKKEIAEEMLREMEEISRGIEEDCKELGTTIAEEDIEAVFDGIRTENRKRFEGLTVEEIARLIMQDTEAGMEELRKENENSNIYIVNS
jgi:hypothetical protein